MMSRASVAAVAVSGLLLGLLAACGGNVVVEGAVGTGASSAGGGGGTSTATVTPSGAGGSASCFDPPSGLTACGTTSGGAGSTCQFDFCDADSNVWGANCSGAACACTQNGMVLCTCALDVSGDICGGTPNCCFLTHGG